MPLAKWKKLSLFGLGLALASLWLVPPASAEDLQKTYNGKLVIAVDPFPKKLDDELSKFLKSNVKKDGRYTVSGDGKTSWEVNFLAFLNKDPGGEPLTLVFYDKADKESQKKFEPVQSVDLSSTKGVRVVRVSEIKLDPDSGFIAGKTYLVRATQLRGGKEVVLAEAQLTLSVTSPVEK
jgi:hypothetical protein